MSDHYARLVRSRPGSLLARRAGLPRPVALERGRPGDPVVRGRVLLGAAAQGALTEPLLSALADARCTLATGPDGQLRSAIANAGVNAELIDPRSSEPRVKALVFDASAIADSSALLALHDFFHRAVPRVQRCGRVIVLGRPAADCRSARERTAQRALEGFTRSLAKEIGGGSTVQLVLAAGSCTGAALASTLRFLLSPRSAYVSGQVIELGPAEPPAVDWELPLRGRTALVTGASRGIGAAIAATLAREGAHVVGLDLHELAAELESVIEPLGGETIALDVTTAAAPAAIAARFSDGLDVVVHNAGVTRDRTLAKMAGERWSAPIEINLSSQERIDERLLAENLLRANGRIVCVSSMSAIAGNAGQTNYATSKAGVIGRVEALAAELRGRDATINGVAPGFIETRMTAAMPLAIREAGRRMSSLGQGGLPIDVAETIAWLAHPASGAVNANVVRVCGQNLLGA